MKCPMTGTSCKYITCNVGGVCQTLARAQEASRSEGRDQLNVARERARAVIEDTGFIRCASCVTLAACFEAEMCAKAVEYDEKTDGWHPCKACVDGEFCRARGQCGDKRFHVDVQSVIEDREASHGDYAKQAYVAQQLKGVLRDCRTLPNAAQQESVEMICVKLSRIVNGDPANPDHWTDIAGYATLISNLLLKGTHL